MLVFLVFLSNAPEKQSLSAFVGDVCSVLHQKNMMTLPKTRITWNMGCKTNPKTEFQFTSKVFMTNIACRAQRPSNHNRFLCKTNPETEFYATSFRLGKLCSKVRLITCKHKVCLAFQSFHSLLIFSWPILLAEHKDLKVSNHNRLLCRLLGMEGKS